MEAHDASLSDILEGSKRSFVIPFFQRAYVWDKENWQDLLEDLLDAEGSHFLGSVIIKPISNKIGGGDRWSIIDGQQRLTTLSVLLKACYDLRVKQIQSENGSTKYVDAQCGSLTTIVQKGGGIVLKIMHSRVDAPAYEKVMKGSSAVTPSSTRILKCYDYFRTELEKRPEDVERLFDLLTEDNKMLVYIQLDQKDNEQAIFDTINSAGVRLTAADTIKNYIFQRLQETSTSPSECREVEELYDHYWEATFAGDEEALGYWNEQVRQGRISRINQEVMLQAVATIEGFYDPNEHAVAQLANCYKAHVDGLSRADLVSLISKIASYAKTYAAFFKKDDANELLKWDDVQSRTLHILRFCDTSTFDPLILKLLTEDPQTGGVLSPTTEKALDEIASYVLRHIVAGASVKNFNKDCSVIIHGTKTLADYFAEKIRDCKIDDAQIRAGLKRIKSSKVGKGILFWLELKKRAAKHVDWHGLPLQVGYGMTLEHLMPQKWQQYWPITNPVPVNPDTGERLTDVQQMEEARAAAVYEIGNMVLLNHSLNTAIRNQSIAAKINGAGGRPGIDGNSDMKLTNDLIASIKANGMSWNEKTIRDRTEQVADEFVSVW